LKRGAALVTILARDKEKLAAAKTELEKLVLQKLSQRVHTLSADVTSEAVRDGLERGLGGFPPVEVLVNSAGVPPLD
jgi:NAD(P)-dependent dehydrogenase (short-subunit alcohol dehydrogenase family)